ncbi:MAG: hypothetical protein ACXQTD_07705, partial [Candidatus Syntropharchaeia archaeon]
KLYMDIRPNLNPEKLSSVLKEVGLDREGQGAVFKALMDKRNFIYDLSVVFTRSSIKNERFFYRERLIKAGKGRSEKFYLSL